MQDAVILLAVCVAALTAWIGLSITSAFDGDWHPWGYRMRRRADGKWEYREPTPEEEQERRDRSAW